MHGLGGIECDHGETWDGSIGAVGKMHEARDAASLVCPMIGKALILQDGPLSIETDIQLSESSPLVSF